MGEREGWYMLPLLVIDVFALAATSFAVFGRKLYIGYCIRAWERHQETAFGRWVSLGATREHYEGGLRLGAGIAITFLLVFTLVTLIATCFEAWG